MKVALYVDGIMVYQKEEIGTTPPPIVPPITPPVVPPPVTPPPPSGTIWQWDTYPMFTLYAGGERVYIVNINKPYSYLKMSISGLTMNTQGSFTWTFPDGRVFPVDGMRQGIKEIVSMNQAGLLVLRAATNIPDNPIPQGNHILSIKAQVDSYFKVSIEVE